MATPVETTREYGDYVHALEVTHVPIHSSFDVGGNTYRGAVCAASLSNKR